MLVVRYLRILAERKVLQFAYTESNEFHMHCRFISLQRRLDTCARLCLLLLTVF